MLAAPESTGRSAIDRHDAERRERVGIAWVGTDEGDGPSIRGEARPRVADRAACQRQRTRDRATVRQRDREEVAQVAAGADGPAHDHSHGPVPGEVQLLDHDLVADVSRFASDSFSPLNPANSDSS